MPDFIQLRTDLRQAKKSQRQTGQELFLTKEKLKKVKQRREQLLRSKNADSNVFNELERQERSFNAQIHEAEGRWEEQIQVTERLLKKFIPLTDPIEGIQQFSDRIPILMFPVRMETRFKKTQVIGDGIQHQLWVRIFPDECSVDNFEEILSEGEIKQAKAFWQIRWSAGTSADAEIGTFIKERHKTAWRSLAGNLQAGRAYWITENYQPENLADLPTRNNKEDIILTIASEELPTPAERTALGSYWRDTWLANESVAELKASMDALVLDIGDENRAHALISEYIPYNFKDAKPSAINPSDIQVSFINFPDSTTFDSMQTSWSQPSQVTTLPERFALIGFKGTDSQGKPAQVLFELGNAIPDPLIIGPNPSVDTTVLLKSEMVAEFNILGTDTLREGKLADYYDELKEAVKAKVSEADFINDFMALPPDQKEMALNGIFDQIRDEVKAALYIDYLTGRSETQWLFEFGEAIRVGMGFKINISQEVHDAGFDRLFALGVKLGADENEAKTDLEELFNHHQFGNNGFSILPQGTATNNTEDEKSGFTEEDDYDASFARYMEESTDRDPDDFLTKKDGKWLCEWLGIDAEESGLKKAEHYYRTDQCEARAMNISLWNATLGYFMESMMSPVFNESQHRLTRRFHNRFVSGRGCIPAIRISDQPYGILPISNISEQRWIGQRSTPIASSTHFSKGSFLFDLFNLLKKVRTDFTPLQEKVAYVGKTSGDPHQNLLDAIGLHASSVKFEQRYAESLMHIFNRFNIDSNRDQISRTINRVLELYRKALNVLTGLGHTFSEKDERISMLDKYFLQESNPLWGNLIDDQPLSEKDPIRSYTEPVAQATEGENYIHWLIKNALNDPDQIKNQVGFSDNERPTALLYQMLRHALNLQFSNTALDLYSKADILNAQQVRAVKVDPDFIGIQEQESTVLTKWEVLDRQEIAITGDEISVAQHISNLVRATDLLDPDASDLREMITALEHLKDLPTARLERAFVEHIDTCSYRLDSWLLSFVHIQLYGMRFSDENGEESEAREGIHLGAYAWLEDLKPDEEVLSTAEIDPTLRQIFDPEDNLTIQKNSTNQGYVHAPSINQATTAAVLRNAYLSNSSGEDPEIYQVNLSSERVRMAMGIIEGMQQGQSLGALLGYQLERGLHDRYAEAEVDTFIYELRMKFPLVANQMEESFDDTEVNSIDQIEARNVVNGDALIKHIEQSDVKNYPYGLDMARGTGPQETIINEEVDRIFNINDAVADLAIAEGVHQVVQGNFERAAGAMDTYSKGSFPQSPDVARTPRSGISLTNRIGIHLEAGIITAAGDHPRIKAEPAINKFLADTLPSMADIFIAVSYQEPTYGTGLVNPVVEEMVSIAQLGLQPIDLLYLLNVESDKGLTALDEYILKWIHRDLPLADASRQIPRPDVEFKINYSEPIDDKITIFEIMPLIKSLRGLLLQARPLKNTDLILSNEASSGEDINCTIDISHINNAISDFNQNFSGADPTDDMDLIKTAFAALVVEDDFDATLGNSLAIINGIDAYLDLFLDRMNSLSLFGEPQAGFGFVYDRKSEIYKGLFQKVQELEKRWTDKEDKYNLLINVQLAAATTDPERIEILQRAERTISTSYTIPLPVAPDIIGKYLTVLGVKKTAFDEKLQEITDWLAGKFVGIKTLTDELIKLKTGVGSATGTPLTDFDLLVLDTAEEERQISVLAEDLINQARKLNASMKEKSIAIQDHLSLYGTEANGHKKIELLTKIAQLLFGEEFKIIPEFSLITAHGDELANAFGDKATLFSHQENEKGLDFPIDDWLYSVARVREKMSDWENVVMLAEGFRTDFTKELHPIQLPYRADDTWLAMEFPEDYEIDGDRLLYTGVWDNFVPTDRQCGLLIDEWTEVIPAKTETTGLTFQYDQPNSEPSQSLLLVTPTEFTGAWKWNDLVGAMHETLNLAKVRAIEPRHVDETDYAHYLPATISSSTFYPFMNIGLNYAIINGLEITESN
tara:strand:- start:10632 stop:16577 length:5946 start_codon:yes stop_codon:yes gene_type:complete